MRDEPRPCHLRCVRVDEAGLLLVLDDGERELPVHVALGDAATHEVLHRHGGYTEHGGGRCRQRLGPEDGGPAALMIRALAATGLVDAPRLLVRPGSSPGFWLELGRGSDARELELDVLDVVALALSDHVPLALVGDRPDWDDELAALVEHGS